MPFQAALFAVNPDSEVIFFTNRNLTGVQDALCPVIELQQAVAVVVEQASLDERRQFRADMRDFISCDVLSEVGSVSTDIADAAARAALLGVCSPAGLHLPCLFQSRRETPLRILHNDLANLAHIALLDHIPG